MNDKFVTDTCGKEYVPEDKRIYHWVNINKASKKREMFENRQNWAANIFLKRCIFIVDQQ